MARGARADDMQIDIWSDIACPWCYLGKRRLEAALTSFEGAEEVAIRWHSFELDPGAPAAYEGDHAERVARKYGRTREEMETSLGSMRAMAAAEGLELNFERIRAGNTFDGHRLLQLAFEHGRQDAMKERLMHAYHTGGELISDHDVLMRLGIETGLPADAVEEMLAGEEYAHQVREDEYTAQQLRIDAVPFFIVDRRLAARGALDAPQMLDALRQAAGTPA
jgi:predicted DsbA family dithiol-disulfide isomerase